jgi:hypothetical protein
MFSWEMIFPETNTKKINKSFFMKWYNAIRDKRYGNNH